MRAIWPLLEQPDFVVILGTGYASENTNLPCMSGPRDILKDGALPRIISAFLSSTSGRRLWQEVPPEANYFRLDIEFPDSEPRLDDTSQMQLLKSQTQAALTKSKELSPLTRSIVASLFYFELEALPKYREGRFFCAGHIMCRLPFNHPAFACLCQQLANASSAFVAQGRAMLFSPDDRSNYREDGNFQKRLEFTVLDRQQKIAISLKERA